MMSFIKFGADGIDPKIPSPDLRGEISSRAAKFCGPVVAANTAGILISPPIDFTITWTGSEFLADIGGISDTILVDKVHLPDYFEFWKQVAPESAVTAMPPFLEALPERGALQVWSGMFVQTIPGVSTWVRGPINWTTSGVWSVVEGIIETDWWIGPLVFVIQFQKTEFPVSFRRETPFLQLVPVDRSILSFRSTDLTARPVSDAPAGFWNGLVATSGRRNLETVGSYRREARRRERNNDIVPS